MLLNIVYQSAFVFVAIAVALCNSATLPSTVAALVRQNFCYLSMLVLSYQFYVHQQSFYSQNQRLHIFFFIISKGAVYFGFLCKFMIGK